jgi:hypothetical protein
MPSKLFFSLESGIRVGQVSDALQDAGGVEISRVAVLTQEGHWLAWRSIDKERTGWCFEQPPRLHRQWLPRNIFLSAQLPRLASPGQAGSWNAFPACLGACHRGRAAKTIRSILRLILFVVLLFG